MSMLRVYNKGYGYGGHVEARHQEQQREHSNGILSIIHQAILRELANGPVSSSELFLKIKQAVPSLDPKRRIPTDDEIRQALWDENFRTTEIELTTNLQYRLRD